MTKQPINTWEQVGHGGVYISRSYTHGRTPSFYGWAVVRPGYKTNPDAPWYDNGCKVFSAFLDNDRGKAALQRAKEWAGREYGIKNWKRNSMGDYIDADAGYMSLRRNTKQ